MVCMVEAKTHSFIPCGHTYCVRWVCKYSHGDLPQVPFVLQEILKDNPYL